MTERKNPSRVLAVLLVICLAAAVFFGVRAQGLSRQREQDDYLALNNALNYVQTVLVTLENEDQWNTGVSFLGMYPSYIYQVEDREDTQAIADMLWALQDVWGDHPNRAQIMEGLKELKVSRDSEKMTFTILEGDAEAINELCKQQQ